MVDAMVGAVVGAVVERFVTRGAPVSPNYIGPNVLPLCIISGMIRYTPIDRSWDCVWGFACIFFSNYLVG